MTDSTDDLAELFIEVTGEEGTREERADEPSREPVDATDDVADDIVAATADGLDDAVAGAEGATDSMSAD